MALWYLVPIISVVSSSWGGVEGFGKNQGGATAVPAGRAVTIGELDSVMNNIRNGVDAGAVIASGPLPLPSSKGNNSVLVSRGAFTPTVASSSTPATVSTFGRSSSFSNGKGGISSTPATVSTFGRSSSPMSNGKGGSSSSGYSRSSNGSSNGNGGSSSNGNGGGISTFGRSIPNGGGVAPASSAPSKNLPPCKGCNNNYYPQNDNVVVDGVNDVEIIVRDPFNPDSILVDETIIVENNAAGSILNEIAQVPMAISSYRPSSFASRASRISSTPTVVIRSYTSEQGLPASSDPINFNLQQSFNSNSNVAPASFGSRSGGGGISTASSSNGKGGISNGGGDWGVAPASSSGRSRTSQYGLAVSNGKGGVSNGGDWGVSPASSSTGRSRSSQYGVAVSNGKGGNNQWGDGGYISGFAAEEGAVASADDDAAPRKLSSIVSYIQKKLDELVR